MICSLTLTDFVSTTLQIPFINPIQHSSFHSSKTAQFLTRLTYVYGPNNAASQQNHKSSENMVPTREL